MIIFLSPFPFPFPFPFPLGWGFLPFFPCPLGAMVWGAWLGLGWLAGCFGFALLAFPPSLLFLRSLLLSFSLLYVRSLLGKWSQGRKNEISAVKILSMGMQVCEKTPYCLKCRM